MAIVRLKEKEIIPKAILERKSLFVYGPEGVGKTFLLRHILENIKDPNISYSGNCSSLKNTLLSLLSYEYSRTSLLRKNILGLKKLFYKLLKREKPYFILDHVSRVSPKFYSFFEYLMDEEIPFTIVSRGISRKEIGHLVMATFYFEKVEMSNLDKLTAYALTDQFIKEFEIKTAKEDDFKKEIFHYSRGNPKIIKGLCSLARDGKYQKDGCLDVKLMDLDLRINEIMR